MNNQLNVVGIFDVTVFISLEHLDQGIDYLLMNLIHIFLVRLK